MAVGVIGLAIVIALSRCEERVRRTRLDVRAYKTELAQRREAAQATAVRVRGAPLRATRPSKIGPGQSLMSDGCILGPGDLCAALAEPAAACDAGDAEACLAVAHYLQDTPPRPLVAILFIKEACTLGNTASCVRFDQLTDRAAPPVACEADPFACGWRAYKSRDEELLESACSLGVADSCASLMDIAETNEDPVRVRAYHEQGCQLGSPAACHGLGQRLATDCSYDCYPADPEESKIALEMACTAGWDFACRPSL